MALSDEIISANDANQASKWVLEGKTIDGILTVESLNSIKIVMALIKKAMMEGQFDVEVPLSYMNQLAVREEISSLGYKIEGIHGGFRVSWDNPSINYQNE